MTNINSNKIDSLDLIASDMWEQTLEFLSSRDRVKWLYSQDEIFKIYVRNRIRLYKSDSFRTLDLATIEIQEDFRGLGLFTKYLRLVETNSKQALYIENVLEPRLSEFLSKRPGWVEIDLAYDKCFMYGY